ncbi:Trm112 family protein [Methylophaga thalassica]|uniref:Trm112 family protein n=1 Tax=Methylophaga thalassica TaxID=40223 RepID=UPI002E7C1890|nr:Trm112 family protein [Methylophaga thalassica]WVI84838.1 Trm112 family protein [Methylophaga thalassica]
MDNALLEILACPACKGKLHYKREAQELFCSACRLAYPVKDDIPVMLIEEARQLPADEEV